MIKEKKKLERGENLPPIMAKLVCKTQVSPL